MSKRFLAFCGAAALAACLSPFAGGAARAQDQPAPAEDKVYKAAEVDEKAVIDRQSQVKHHPEGYRCASREGLVRVRAVLRKSGEVTDVSVVRPSGCPDFDEMALRGVRRIAFKPAKKDGRLVSQSVFFEFAHRVH